MLHKKGWVNLSQQKHLGGGRSAATDRYPKPTILPKHGTVQNERSSGLHQVGEATTPYREPLLPSSDDVSSFSNITRGVSLTMENNGDFWRDLLTAGTPRETMDQISKRVIASIGEAPPGVKISSTELGYKLWPKEQRVPKADKDVIMHLFTVLRRLAKDRLKDMCREEWIPGGPSGHRKAFVWFNPNGPDGLVEPIGGATVRVGANFARRIIKGLRGEYDPVYMAMLISECEKAFGQLAPEEEQW